MKIALEAKVDQNEDVRKEVISTKGKLYEATYDNFCGCALPLSKRNFNKFGEAKGQNHLGKLWESIRDQLLTKR